MSSNIKLGGDGSLPYFWIETDTAGDCITTYAISTLHNQILVGFEGDSGVYQLDLVSSKNVAQYFIADSSIRSIAVSPNGMYALAGADNGVVGVINFEEKVVCKPKKLISGSLKEIFFLDADNVCAISKLGEISIINSRSLDVVFTHKGCGTRIWCSAYSSINKRLFIAGEDGVILAYAINSGVIEECCNLPPYCFKMTTFTGLVYLEREDLLVSVDEAGRLISWSTCHDTLIPFREYCLGDKLYNVSSNENYIAAYSEKNEKIALISIKSLTASSGFDCVHLNCKSSKFNLSDSKGDSLYYLNDQGDVVEVCLKSDGEGVRVGYEKLLVKSFSKALKFIKESGGDNLILFPWRKGIFNVKLNSVAGCEGDSDIGLIGDSCFGSDDDIVWILADNSVVHRTVLQDSKIIALSSLKLDDVFEKITGSSNDSLIVESIKNEWQCVEKTKFGESLAGGELRSRLIKVDVNQYLLTKDHRGNFFGLVKENNKSLLVSYRCPSQSGLAKLFESGKIPVSGEKFSSVEVIDCSMASGSYVNIGSPFKYYINSCKKYLAIQEVLGCLDVFELIDNGGVSFVSSIDTDMIMDPESDLVISNLGEFVFIKHIEIIEAYSLDSAELLWQIDDEEFTYCRLLGYVKNTDRLLMISHKSRELIAIGVGDHFEENDRFLAVEIDGPWTEVKLSPGEKKLLLSHTDKSIEIIDLVDLIGG